MGAANASRPFLVPDRRYGNARLAASSGILREIEGFSRQIRGGGEPTGFC